MFNSCNKAGIKRGRQQVTALTIPDMAMTKSQRNRGLRKTRFLRNCTRFRPINTLSLSKCNINVIT